MILIIITIGWAVAVTLTAIAITVTAAVNARDERQQGCFGHCSGGYRDKFSAGQAFYDASHGNESSFPA